MLLKLLIALRTDYPIRGTYPYHASGPRPGTGGVGRCEPRNFAAEGNILRDMQLWPAPSPDRPVSAELTIPGSKSLTNRALVLAALADGDSTIDNPLNSRDSRLMIDGLRELGAGIGTRESSGADTTASVRISPLERTDGGHRTVQCGLAGTVMRFLAPVAAIAGGSTHFVGDAQAERRPMAGLLRALEALGLTLAPGGAAGLPYTLHSAGVIRGGRITVDARASSQFVSALLLSAPRFSDGLDLHVEQTPPALPHIEMTVAMLRKQGAEVTAEPRRWQVSPGAVSALDLVIEPDLSNATPFMAGVMLTGGSITITGIGTESLQPTAEVMDLFGALGAHVTAGPASLTVAGTGEVHSVEVDLGALGELVPTVAALCAFADGVSTLRGIAHLRGHETDRLAALAEELRNVGATVTELDDGLRIIPGSGVGPVRPWASYADHRMATAGAIVGLRVPGLQVENIATTSKTFPGFAEQWLAVFG